MSVSVLETKPSCNFQNEHLVPRVSCSCVNGNNRDFLSPNRCPADLVDSRGVRSYIARPRFFSLQINWWFRSFCPRSHRGSQIISFLFSPTWVSFQDHSPDTPQSRDQVAVFNSDPCIAGTNSKCWTDQQAGSKNKSMSYSPKGTARAMQSHDTHLSLKF